MLQQILHVNEHEFCWFSISVFAVLICMCGDIQKQNKTTSNTNSCSLLLLYRLILQSACTVYSRGLMFMLLPPRL